MIPFRAAFRRHDGDARVPTGPDGLRRRKRMHPGRPSALARSVAAAAGAHRALPFLFPPLVAFSPLLRSRPLCSDSCTD
jgi:hypothetical protein